MLKYVSKVSAFLSKLGEWEIEFKAIKVETPHAFHIHFAALGIKYHYLTLIYVTLLTVCYAIPITQASNEIKASSWSWSAAGNKTVYPVLELWNKFAGAMSKARNNNSSSASGSGQRQDSTSSVSNSTSIPTSPSLSPFSPLSPRPHPASTPPLVLNPSKYRSTPSPPTGSTQWSSSPPTNLGAAVPGDR
ncbi:hypothetical protein M422DRAFT_27487 [Sphaerobolus stellatus SS14]|nr:hypothetical protein M422DRAFT_27487 [Sphaerobolus stellatus SS14]